MHNPRRDETHGGTEHEAFAPFAFGAFPAQPAPRPRKQNHDFDMVMLLILPGHGLLPYVVETDQISLKEVDLLVVSASGENFRRSSFIS